MVEAAAANENVDGRVPAVTNLNVVPFATLGAALELNVTPVVPPGGVTVEPPVAMSLPWMECTPVPVGARVDPCRVTQTNPAGTLPATDSTTLTVPMGWSKDVGAMVTGLAVR